MGKYDFRFVVFVYELFMKRYALFYFSSRTIVVGEHAATAFRKDFNPQLHDENDQQDQRRLNRIGCCEGSQADQIPDRKWFQYRSSL